MEETDKIIIDELMAENTVLEQDLRIQTNQITRLMEDLKRLNSEVKELKHYLRTYIQTDAQNQIAACQTAYNKQIKDLKDRAERRMIPPYTKNNKWKF